jgi:benzoyl-CoA reductase/2-hydroxyglutaryl-CoA dehydratase subunit BcrC/BadD/HgdB
MSFSDPRLASVLRDPLAAAVASARPIVLYVSNDTPVELIYAAGGFPLQLPTAARASYPRADQYLEPNFEPMVRAALEQLLQGELSAASLLVLPRSNDAWQRLYYYLCELSRSFGARLPEPFLYDLQKLPTASSAAYNADSTRLLSDTLRALTGVEPDVHAAIAQYNQLRGALHDVLQRRYERPSRLPGAAGLELLTAVQRQDPGASTQALRALPDTHAPASGVRTLLVGSTHDTPQLHHLIAQAGGQVVYDFHTRGDWSFGPLIAEQDDAMAALTAHYHQHSLCTRSHPLPLPALLDAAALSGAEVAVFFYYAEEEALTWDYPAQAAALAARGIRSLLLPKQPYPISPDVDAALRPFFATGVTP